MHVPPRVVGQYGPFGASEVGVCGRGEVGDCSSGDGAFGVVDGWIGLYVKVSVPGRDRYGLRHVCHGCSTCERGYIRTDGRTFAKRPISQSSPCSCLSEV
jgi:hypothetical protein